MKKTYSKPEIVFEAFTLNTAIAGDCSNPTGTPSQMQCGYEMGGVMVFIESANGCNLKVEDGSYGDGLCYHVPTAGNNLFNS